MKRLTFGLVMMLVGASWVAATGIAEEPERPRSLVVGHGVGLLSLDPHAATSVDEFRIIGNVFEGLVRFADGSLTIEPSLATAWEISEDGLTYTFELREEVVFHDGTPFDARAVKLNFDRLRGGSARPPAGDSFQDPLAFEAISETRVLDEYTVQILLAEPFAPLLSSLASPSAMIVAPSAGEDGALPFGRDPVGTGPYRFVGVESGAGNSAGLRVGADAGGAAGSSDAVGPSGGAGAADAAGLRGASDPRDTTDTRVALEAADQYWGEAPRVERIVFRWIPDPNERITELLAGRVDILVDVPPDSVQVFSQRDDFVVYQEAAPHVWALILNLREGPFTERSLRLAANYAIDKEALVDNVLMGAATVAAGPIAPVFDWAHHGALAPYPFDPVRAEELIAESGYRGEELVFSVPTGGTGMLDPVQMGRAIRADLEAVGFNVAIETFPWNTHRSRVRAGLEGRADLAQMAWITTDPDTLPYLSLRTGAWPERGGFNAGYYSNARVDELLRRARGTTDRTERAELYREVQEIVHNDVPWVVVAHGTQTVIATTRVGNLALQPSYLLPLQGVTVE